MSKSELRDPQAYTAQEHAVELAEEQLCSASRFGEWIECATAVRESSAYWGPISNAELIETALTDKCTPEQCYAAMRTLRRRFLSEHAEQRAQIVAGMMEESK